MTPSTLARLCLLSASALALPLSSTAQAKLAGDWQGTLDAGGTTYHVAWHAAALSDGTVTSTFDNIDQSIFGIKVKSTIVKGSEIAMTVNDVVSSNGQDITIRGDFAGVISTDGNEVNGTWTQTEPEQPPTQVHFKRAAAQASASSAAQTSVVGDWAGTLTAGPAQLRLVLHIIAAKDSTLTGTLDSIDQGVNGIPVNPVALKESKLSLVLGTINGAYEGTVNKDGTAIAGTWSQGQAALPLTFNRAQPQAAAPAPRPAAPTDIDGTWQGTLDTPAGNLRILFKIANMDNGLTATVQSPDQSPAWMPTTSVTRTGNKLTIVMKGLGASYDGEINAGKDTVSGTFTQGGGSVPLVIRKS